MRRAFEIFFMVFGLSFMVWAMFENNSAMELFGMFFLLGGYYDLATDYKLTKDVTQ